MDYTTHTVNTLEGKKMRINISLTEYDHEQAKALAKSLDRSVSNLFVWLMRQYINSQPAKTIRPGDERK